MNVTIYQIKENTKSVMFLFRGWERVKDFFNFKNYKKVWSGTFENLVDEIPENTNDKLDVIFNIFNIHHPKNFRGHSLSTSDIVKLDNEYFFCDSFGWENVTNKIN